MNKFISTSQHNITTGQLPAWWSWDFLSSLHSLVHDHYLHSHLVLVSCYGQTRYTLDGFQQALTAPQELLEQHCTLIKLLCALLFLYMTMDVLLENGLDVVTIVSSTLDDWPQLLQLQLYRDSTCTGCYNTTNSWLYVPYKLRKCTNAMSANSSALLSCLN